MAVIRKDAMQRFYTHEVVIQKEDGARAVQTGVLNNQYLPGDASRLPIESILDQISNVNLATEISSEAKTKFSLQSPVEETKDLVAVHNLTEDSLQGALALGDAFAFYRHCQDSGGAQ